MWPILSKRRICCKKQIFKRGLIKMYSATNYLRRYQKKKTRKMIKELMN
jgi:hypothetical protein